MKIITISMFTVALIVLNYMSLIRSMQVNSAAKRSFWSSMPLAPADKILGLNEKFKADQFPAKVNLGVGAYRDNFGRPYVLNSIKTAETRIINKSMDKEYAAITGVPEFVTTALEFAYGTKCDVVVSGRVAATQTISGTGGCRVAAEFIRTFFGNVKIHIPNPTWGNHLAVFRNAGLEPVYYKYYDAATRSIDFAGIVSAIRQADNGSLFMFHACAHNPTGCDPTKEQWDELSSIIKEKEHMVFFDCAYQGFASGDAEADAYSIRKFVADGHQIMLAQSFAKNFGLYGERVGLLSVVTDSKEESERVVSQLKLVVRAIYSSPPLHGARIVAEVLSDPVLKAEWYAECKGMADRINSMRLLLRAKLEEGIAAAASKSDAATTCSSSSSIPTWNHITDQIGMFCYTGLSEQQVLRLREEFHIYCTDDGRFSMAGINTGNIDYLAASVIAVL